MAETARFSRLSIFVTLVATLGACGSTREVLMLHRPSIAGRPALVIAHRGGSLEAPENTLAAFRHGRDAGADWLELDVHLTRDEAVVVIHDGRVDRTTGGKGDVAEMTLAEMRALDAGRPNSAPDVTARLAREGLRAPDFGDRFAGERVPTLAEALGLGGRVMIELKASARPETLVRRTLETIAETDAARRVAIASFDPKLLALAKQGAPDIPLIGLVDHASRLPPMLDLGVEVLAVWQGLLDDIASGRADIERPDGLRPALWVWTIYGTPRAMDLDARGVDGIITDAPEAVRRALERRDLPES
jgi:glycerophosphoryl diester phosphodiesterase